jgi:anti-sigma-K factor RskA
MKSYLQHLDSEAILLMYLGDELPAQDRAELERMLESDAALRRELEILRQTQQLAFDALGAVDAVTRPAVPVMVAQRRVSRFVREWADQRRRSAMRVSEPWLRLSWRRISLAAAAMLLVGCYIWAVYHHLLTYKPPGREPTVLLPHRELSVDEKVALLSMPMEDSTSDESNLHVAEVAAATPSDAENFGDINSAGSSPAGGSDWNATGEP